MNISELNYQKLKCNADLLLPLVAMNAANSVKGLRYLITSINESGRKTALCTINESNWEVYTKRLKNYSEEIESINKSTNSIAKLIFLQLIAEKSEKDMDRILGTIYNFKLRSRLSKYLNSTCPSSDAIYHTFSSFRQLLYDGTNSRRIEDTVNIITELGFSVLFRGEDIKLLPE